MRAVFHNSRVGDYPIFCALEQLNTSNTRSFDFVPVRSICPDQICKFAVEGRQGNKVAAGLSRANRTNYLAGRCVSGSFMTSYWDRFVKGHRSGFKFFTVKN
jgi:hypothetical protein